jgi:hypothetical protein
MSLSSWLQGVFTGRGNAMAFYHRGMAKAEKHNHQGAIEDYSAAIDDLSAPRDVKAMALYNRALVFSAIGENQKATEDLNVVLGMEESFVNIKTMAKQKLARMVTRATRNAKR